MITWILCSHSVSPSWSVSMLNITDLLNSSFSGKLTELVTKKWYFLLVCAVPLLLITRNSRTLAATAFICKSSVVTTLHKHQQNTFKVKKQQKPNNKQHESMKWKHSIRIISCDAIAEPKWIEISRSTNVMILSQIRKTSVKVFD